MFTAILFKKGDFTPLGSSVISDGFLPFFIGKRKTGGKNGADYLSGRRTGNIIRKRYFTLTTSPTLKPVPVGMLPVVVHRTWVTQSSYPAGAPHPPLAGVYVQVDPLLLE